MNACEWPRSAKNTRKCGNSAGWVAWLPGSESQPDTHRATCGVHRRLAERIGWIAAPGGEG